MRLMTWYTVEVVHLQRYWNLLSWSFLLNFIRYSKWYNQVILILCFWLVIYSSYLHVFRHILWSFHELLFTNPTSLQWYFRCRGRGIMATSDFFLHQLDSSWMCFKFCLAKFWILSRTFFRKLRMKFNATYCLWCLEWY